MPDQFPTALEALPDGLRGAHPEAVRSKPGRGPGAADDLPPQAAGRRRQHPAALRAIYRGGRELIASGAIGELYDLEVHVNVKTPWQLFPQVLALDRLEINMHSVHYLDLIRSFLGDPDSVSAVTERRPETTPRQLAVGDPAALPGSAAPGGGLHQP